MFTKHPMILINFFFTVHIFFVLVVVVVVVDSEEIALTFLRSEQSAQFDNRIILFWDSRIYYLFWCNWMKQNKREWKRKKKNNGMTSESIYVFNLIYSFIALCKYADIIHSSRILSFDSQYRENDCIISHPRCALQRATCKYWRFKNIHLATEIANLVCHTLVISNFQIILLFTYNGHITIITRKST